MEKQRHLAEEDQEPKSNRYIDKLSQKWNSLSAEEKVYFSALGVFVFASAMDVSTTALAVGQGAVELNPFMKNAVENGGILVTATIKTVAVTCIIAICERVRRHNNDPDFPLNWFSNTIRGANILYTYAAINNIMLYLDKIA